MKKDMFVRYASVAELSAALRNGKKRSCWDKSAFDADTGYSTEWFGETLQNAIRKLDVGDVDKAAKIKAEGEILAEPNSGFAPRIELGVYGCLPSIPNYLRGVPANMMRVRRDPRRMPVIDMYVECAIYDGIDTNKVTKAAARIANVIVATEQSGVRVNLYATCGSRDSSGDGSSYGICVKLKDADAPINLLNIAFCICNRAFCRCIFVRWMEFFVNKKIKNYGRPMTEAEIKNTFQFQGILFSIIELADYETSLESIAQKVNDYIKAS